MRGYLSLVYSFLEDKKTKLYCLVTFLENEPQKYVSCANDA